MDNIMEEEPSLIRNRRFNDKGSFSLLEKILFLVVTLLSIALIAVIAVWASEDEVSSAAVVAKQIKASCHLRADPSKDQNLKGTIMFTQNSGEQLLVNVSISGLPNVTASDPAVTTGRGLHVHYYGDITGGCGSTKGHYDPRDVPHRGHADAVRHPGDFGNFPQTTAGIISKSWTDDLATLYGEESIVGRGMVLHAGQDDLGVNLNDTGSQSNGNAGARLGCCVIGLVPST